MTRSIDNQNIILFDGVCNLCSGIVKFIIKRDRKALFKFAALQSEIGNELLNVFNISTDHMDTFVYIRKNKALIRSTAGIYVLKDMGGLWRGLFVFIIVPEFLRNFFYELIAKSRYRVWGRKESCMIPDENILERFI